MKKTLRCRKKNIRLFIITLLAVVFICSTGVVVFANPDKSATSNTYLMSVRVQPGDSLWSIAEEYCPNNMDMNDYIDGIKTVNNMKTNNISSGDYLVVTVYN